MKLPSYRLHCKAREGIARVNKTVTCKTPPSARKPPSQRRRGMAEELSFTKDWSIIRRPEKNLFKALSKDPKVPKRQKLSKVEKQLKEIF